MKTIEETFVANWGHYDPLLRYVIDFYVRGYVLPDDPRVVCNFTMSRIANFATKVLGAPLSVVKALQAEDTDHFIHACFLWLMCDPAKALAFYRAQSMLIDEALPTNSYRYGIILGCATTIEIEALRLRRAVSTTIDGHDHPSVVRVYERFLKSRYDAGKPQEGSSAVHTIGRCQYDFAVCMNTMEHMEHPVPFIKKMLVCLKYGGRFIGNIDATPEQEDNVLHVWKVDSYRDVLLPVLKDTFKTIRFLTADETMFSIDAIEGEL